MRNLLVQFLIVALVTTALAQEASEPIPIVYDSETAWMNLPSVSPDPGEPFGTTDNAHRFTRAFHHDTGEALSAQKPEFDCDPDDLRRTFRLEKREFLLGEPILVEYRVELNGPGKWMEPNGGNYRSRGRDDNFTFLLRREDGSWVDDIQPHASPDGGGISTVASVDGNTPYSVWQSVQRWCAIAAPGRYELYCFYQRPDYTYETPFLDAAKALVPPELLRDHAINEDGKLIDTATGAPSTRYFLVRDSRQYTRSDSPLLARMPAPIHTFLDEEDPSDSNQSAWAGPTWERTRTVRSAEVFAQFPIEIREGTQDERDAMVAHWTEVVGRPESPNDRSGRIGTIVEAIQLSLSTDFLPLIESWASTKSSWRHTATLNAGLMRLDDPRASALLLDRGVPLLRILGPENFSGESPQSDARRRANLATLIAFLGDPHQERRTAALGQLRDAADGWFIGDEHAAAEALDADQWIRAQAKWRAWLAQLPQPMPREGQGTWGYIDRKGTMIIAPQFTLAQSFKDGTAEVGQGDENFHIDRTGTTVTVAEPVPPQEEPPFRFKEGDLWGYRSADGDIAIPPRFKSATKFRNGHATVYVDHVRKFIDSTGQVLLGDEYTIVSVHDDGMMTFTVPHPKGKRYGLLDRDGTEILPPIYGSIRTYSEDRIEVGVPSPSGYYEYGFADPSGTVVIPLRYADAEAFSDGLAAVRLDTDPGGLWGFIDTAGTMVIPPRFRRVSPFTNSLAAALNDDTSGEAVRFGYVDKTGAWVIPPQFVRAGPFSEGLAAVKVEKEQRWLDGP